MASMTTETQPLHYLDAPGNREHGAVDNILSHSILANIGKCA